jgi:predicted RNA binding protein YcfA (HicA-like mRNA interferase family)
MGLRNLPQASGEDHCAAFERLGWIRDRKRRGRGKHILLTKSGIRATLSIPDEREVKRTIIASLIRLAGETETSYLRAFNGR